MTEPYYQDDHVTLYRGDCLELADLWTCADVLVTDPPYGMSYESNRNRDRRNMKVGRSIAADQSTDARDQALGAWGEKRPTLVFGRWDQPRPAATRARLIWDRCTNGMGDLSFPWGPSDEEIYVLGSGFTGKRTGSVIRFLAVNSQRRDRVHPTQKPIELMQALIGKCPPGVIADPFAGSGTTLVAAKALGRKAIGVELEEKYCEIAAKRLAQDAFDFVGGE